MSDLLKVVNPPEIQAYGTRVNTRVDEITTELDQLCRNVESVDYGGTHAVAFKTQAGDMANRLVTNLQTRIGELKTAIATATTNIATELGGQPIVINLENNTIAQADPGTDSGNQWADPTALTTLINQVNTRFSQLTTAINGLKELPPNDRGGWMGNARNQTEEYVNSFVSGATSTCEDSQTSLVDFVTKQRDGVVAKDRA